VSIDECNKGSWKSETFRPIQASVKRCVKKGERLNVVFEGYEEGMERCQARVSFDITKESQQAEGKGELQFPDSNCSYKAKVLGALTIEYGGVEFDGIWDEILGKGSTCKYNFNFNSIVEGA